VLTIVNRLASLTQLLSSQKESFYKIRASAARIRDLSASLDDMRHSGKDLTNFPGIGKRSRAQILEIVTTTSSSSSLVD
jgi:DNA polymerase/3'-5' exonuclease PolX